jgi:L-lactate dehydrogenase complex protein LldE
MLKRKIANLEKTQAPTLVMCDAGCLMHIQGGLKRNKMKQRVVHIAEVLNNTVHAAKPNGTSVRDGRHR